MSIKKKYFIGWIVFILLMIIWSWCIINYSTKFLIPALITFFGMGFFSMSLKCPSCHKNVLLDKYNILGGNIQIATPWVHSKCTHCGHEFK